MTIDLHQKKKYSPSFKQFYTVLLCCLFLGKIYPPQMCFLGQRRKGACFRWSYVKRLFTYPHAKSKSN